MTDTLTLGHLQFVGRANDGGIDVEILSGGDPIAEFCLSLADWSSLTNIRTALEAADVRHGRDREEIERLRAALLAWRIWSDFVSPPWGSKESRTDDGQRKKIGEELSNLRMAVVKHLPHPNGPDNTTPGDPDAWNAAMQNLGDAIAERDALRAQLAAVTAARDELAVGWSVQIDESENPSSAESAARHDRIDELRKAGAR